MATPVQEVYDSFLARIESDEWLTDVELALARAEFAVLLDMAIDRFERPRIPIEVVEVEEEVEGEEDPVTTLVFTETLSRAERNLLALYMKHEWIKRCVTTWENVRSYYTNRDFSAANHLDKLIKLSEQLELECFKAQRRYRRNVNGKTFDFTVFAGGHKNVN